MPDVPNRAELERRLIREISRADVTTRRELYALLGDPPQLANLTPQVWDDIAQRYSGVIAPALERVFIDSSELFLSQVGLAVGEGIVQTRAGAWAAEYGANLVNNLNTTSRREIGRLVGNYFQDGQTIGELQDNIQRVVYNPTRAKLIAQTEITRANVEAEIEMVEELGNTLAAKWVTNRDDLVCPICGPLDGRAYGDLWVMYPPAHPGCRCWVVWEPV
jgi:hypothetical protein